MAGRKIVAAPQHENAVRCAKHSLQGLTGRPNVLQSEMDMTTEPEETDRQFVTALARGLDILGCFRTEDRYLSNHVIAQRTGLARPTVSRLTYTLMKTGHLHRHDDSGEYRLGPKVLQLGFGALAGVNLRERADEVLTQLCSGPNPYLTIALAERSGIRAIYVAARRQRQAVSLSIDVGARLPLFYSGIGRAILAGMTPAERDAALAQGIEEFPDQRDRMTESLAEALTDFEQYGYCTSFGAWKPEINAIAAPIRSLDGSSVYGLNVGGPSFLVSAEELHRTYGPRLLRAVAELGGT